MLTLPSWRDVRWVRGNRPDPHALASLVAIEFAYSRPAPFYPLFYRQIDGTILFPRTGVGVYWNCELDALRAGNWIEGIDYEILWSYNCYGAQEAPLDFLQRAYDIRLALKRLGDMAQETFKLGINSVYGKFAQQEGYRPAIPGVCDERYPSYHCLAWASMATARVRSVLYQAALAAPDEVVAFATDAILSTGTVDGITVGSGLGEWTVERYDGLVLVQAGVYWLKDPETHEWASKYRGFDPDSLYEDKVIDAWSTGLLCTKEGHRGEHHLPVTLTRFVGMGSALARTDFDRIWRTWETEDRCLDLLP
jgi:hypothetical protein